MKLSLLIRKIASLVDADQWQQILLLGTGLLISYADRSNIALAILPISEEYKWSLSDQGIILSSFFYGYIVTQILGGILADKYGGKLILIIAGLSWGVCTILLPYMASYGIYGIALVRFFLGLGEGVSFPATHSLISQTISRSSRSTAVSVITSFSYAGSPLAALVTAPLSTVDNWRKVFYYFGITSLIWTLAWFLFGKGDKKRSIDDDGYDSIENVPFESETLDSTALSNNSTIFKQLIDDLKVAPWSQIFHSREVWAILINQFCSSWSFYILINWLPRYLEQKYNVDTKDLGFYSALPYAMQGVVGIASGLLSDHLLKTTSYSVTVVRRYFQVLGMVLPSFFLILLSFSSTLTTSIIYLTLTMSFSGFTLSALSTSQHDIAPNHAGLIFALGNTVATIPGQIAVLLTGYMLDWGYSWAAIFGVAALVRAIGGAFWWIWGGGDRVIIR